MVAIGGCDGRRGKPVLPAWSAAVGAATVAQEPVLLAAKVVAADLRAASSTSSAG